MVATPTLRGHEIIAKIILPVVRKALMEKPK